MSRKVAICTSARYNREWSSGDDDEGSMRKGSNEADKKKIKKLPALYLKQ